MSVDDVFTPHISVIYRRTPICFKSELIKQEGDNMQRDRLESSSTVVLKSKTHTEDHTSEYLNACFSV